MSGDIQQAKLSDKGCAQSFVGLDRVCRAREIAPGDGCPIGGFNR